MPTAEVEATHVVSKFPEDGGEHGQGGVCARKAHLAEARAIVTDEGHVHCVVRDADGAAGDTTRLFVPFVRCSTEGQGLALWTCELTTLVLILPFPGPGPG